MSQRELGGLQEEPAFVGARVKPEQAQRLREFADEQDLTVSQVVRRALARELDGKEPE